MSRLLVCIQAVDLDDPLIGFFVPWLEEAAKHFSEVTVLALRVGRYTLPPNITVIPTRPTGSTSKWAVIKTVLLETWRRRRTYDAVFVRGEPQYVLLAGWLWRLLGKKLVFWYAHYRVSRWARYAAHIATFVVSSAHAASQGIANVITIGQGIDGPRFVLKPRPLPKTWNILIFGRMDASKRVKELLEFFLRLDQASSFQLTLIGRAGNELYEQALDVLIKDNPRIHWQKESPAYDTVPSLFGEYHVILNATDGSLDKTIIEGALSGLLPVASTSGMTEWLPVEAKWLHWTTEADFKRVMERIVRLSEAEYQTMLVSIRAAAEANHTTQSQIRKIVALLDQP